MSCSVCGKRTGDLISVSGAFYCQACAVGEAEKSILITTTPALEQWRITNYLDVESIEVVIGSKEITNFTDARYAALRLLKLAAFYRSATAVVGIDLDYVEINGRVLLIASGTLVQAVKSNS